MNTETLLVELGTEELPPKDLKTLGLAFREGVLGGLSARELAHGEARWFATPRRLAVLVEDVAAAAPARQLELLGPPAERARDDSGAWTQAAAGFARKQGVAPDDLELIDTPKGQRLGLRREEAGARTADSLGTIIDEALAGLPISKRMRWGANRMEFVRPVHWVVALFGDELQPCEVFGIAAGSCTRGHRFHADRDIPLAHPADYEQALAEAWVVPDFERRRSMIREQVAVEASALGARAVIDDDLLDEVTGLVEWPVALTGAFDERFLAVPPEALVSAMKEHQKYFHVVDADGELLPHFITIANIESRDPAQVIAGNERVIRPRLADAAFFYEQDRQATLASRVAALKDVVFQKDLGTLWDKTSRVQCLVRELAGALGAPADDCERAAHLAKADLTTELVLEFGDLQGIAGTYYARYDGEAPGVAEALQQQYWPRFAGDRLPEGPVATALALADRLDTLVGIFGIGQPPTGSRDPFALRRAALAVLRILVEKAIDLDLRDALALAAAQFPAGTLADDTIEQTLAYSIERFRAWFEDEGIPGGTFRAVAALGPSRPLDIHRRVHAVHAFSDLPEAEALAAANKRVANILAKTDDDSAAVAVDPARFVEPAESALWDALTQAGAASEAQLTGGAYREALAALATLREPVDRFFDEVMVNAEDPALRANRRALLQALRQQFLAVADISLLEPR
ncbi:glycine--tRNA ligase subunit beta [Pseudohaliea rubra]|uniref:Glycine--tRNA ligase beta subunit n=1 Tax=Pseudohaliea rubra DSM 19751 TaxID=1265313 RepID=A0A095XXH2_9GAMM|nr:glycine--tRNA ligase subunit beta [Pseudohaliea rubra]KGE04426.1 Glycyl-tRNA synthetase beta chain [Pseudohaliea rubra DSM 19751]